MFSEQELCFTVVELSFGTAEIVIGALKTISGRRVVCKKKAVLKIADSANYCCFVDKYMLFGGDILAYKY